MAIIELGSLISSIKGSIGGVTFSRNASGIIAKSKLWGKKSKTKKQLLALQADAELIRRWNLLSLSDQLSWAGLASEFNKVDRYNVSKKLTGYNWFVSLNYVYYYETGLYFTVPPALVYPSMLPSFDLVLSTSDIIVNWSVPLDTSVLGIFVYGSSPIRGTERYKRGSLRLLDVRDLDYSSSFSVLAAWELATGLVWADIATDAQFYLNFQIFAYAKTSGITGIAVSNTAGF